MSDSDAVSCAAQVANNAMGAEGVTSGAGVNDTLAEWEAKAAQQYGFDGDMAGWDSAAEEEETAEQKYIRVSARTILFACLHLANDPLKNIHSTDFDSKHSTVNK